MAGKSVAKKSKSAKSRNVPPKVQDDNSEMVKNELLADLEDTGVTPEERTLMIEEMAYYRAQKRGFSPGEHLQDWLEAESIVDSMLGNSVHPPGTLSHH
jgi:hypothetical protein